MTVIYWLAGWCLASIITGICYYGFRSTYIEFHRRKIVRTERRAKEILSNAELWLSLDYTLNPKDERDAISILRQAKSQQFPSEVLCGVR